MGADDHDIGIREWYLVLIDIVYQDVLVLFLYTPLPKKLFVVCFLNQKHCFFRAGI